MDIDAFCSGCCESQSFLSRKEAMAWIETHEQRGHLKGWSISLHSPTASKHLEDEIKAETIKKRLQEKASS